MSGQCAVHVFSVLVILMELWDSVSSAALMRPLLEEWRNNPGHCQPKLSVRRTVRE